MPGQSPKRGAIPTPRSALAAATPYRPYAYAGIPPNFIMNPIYKSKWGNDHHGDCVTAEEAFAKACSNPEIDISDDDAIAWATQHGVLNGAYINQVLSWMQNDGFADGSSLYDNGGYRWVDFADAPTLRSAIAQGPVKLGVASTQIGTATDATSGKSGWFGTGWTEESDYDHCVSLCGYGSLSWLAQQLGVQVPSGVDGRKPGYAMFTWGTIGIVDVPSMKAITNEAWLRQPTTVIKAAPAWQTDDLTAITGASAAAGNPAAYVFDDAKGTQHVIFRGADGDIYELWRDKNGWHAHDLTDLTGAPAAAGDPAAYLFQVFGSQHVMFRDADNHINQLWDDGTHGWRFQDLTAITGAPDAAGDPAAYADEDYGSQHVMFRDADNDIYELWDDGTHGWRFQDLTAITGAAAAAGDPTAYTVDDRRTQHVMFLSADNHIQELWDETVGKHPRWRSHDLTDIAGAAAAAGPPVGYVFDGANTQRAMFRGTDNHIHELRLDDSGWHDDDLTTAAGAPDADSDPAGYTLTDQNTQYVMFRGTDNHIHELRWE